MPAGGLHEQDCLPEARVRDRARRISPGGCALRDHRRSRLGLSNMQHGRPWRSVASALAQLRTASSAARVNRLSWYITPILWSGLSVSMMSLLWVCRSVVDTFPRATSPTAGPTVPPCRCVSCPGRPHGKPTQVHVHDQEPPRPPGIVCGDSRVRRLGASVTRPGVVEGPAPISQFGVVLAQPAQAAPSHARWKRLGHGSPKLPDAAPGRQSRLSAPRYCTGHCVIGHPGLGMLCFLGRLRPPADDVVGGDDFAMEDPHDHAC